MISAKLIKDSIAPHGKRLTTFELEFPRWILAEFNTHRMLSRNVASSRAIPVSTVISMIESEPAIPLHWGKNQAGMSASVELGENEQKIAKSIWLEARDSAIKHAKQLTELGGHKQWVNRLLEPWVNIKVVATATEWDNFFYLRNHPDAQPEIHALAEAMLEAWDASTPTELYYDQWHLPYVEGDALDWPLEDQLKLSSSLCAQTSFRKADETLEKATSIYDRLVESKPVHASPFEHQAKPAVEDDKRSGNFIGWIQHRQLIPNNVCHKYVR